MSKMMKRALVGAMIVTVALAGAEAFAATCTTNKTLSTQTCCSWRTTSSGVKYCALWCTGSEICDNLMSGLGSAASGCTGETCPAVSCAAYGTVPPDKTNEDCGGSNLDILNPDCGIQGVAFCLNPAGNSSNAQGQPFTLFGVQQTSAPVTNCDKKGKCTQSLTLEPTDTSNVCINPNWQLETFTATEFKGKACFCPGGYEKLLAPDADFVPRCCADNSRNGDGTCATVYAAGLPTAGTPICITAHCTINLTSTNYNPGDNLPYECPSTRTCGGITEECCPGQVCPLPPPQP